ncbi:MAG: hypothetical protein OSW77_03080 [Proteobacteria bacterium]|nr:hypothetical protein [Pseudomonadota bacterium]
MEHVAHRGIEPDFVVQLERQIGLRRFGVEPDAGAGGNVLGYLSTPYRIL